MSDTVLNEAQRLEQLIRESTEFADLKLKYDRVFQDRTAREIFEKFRDAQFRLQEKQMSGREITPEEWGMAQRLADEVQHNPLILSLFEAEQKMSQLIRRVNEILWKPLDELYSQPMAE